MSENSGIPSAAPFTLRSAGPSWSGGMTVGSSGKPSSDPSSTFGALRIWSRRIFSLPGSRCCCSSGRPKRLQSSTSSIAITSGLSGSVARKKTANSIGVHGHGLRARLLSSMATSVTGAGGALRRLCMARKSAKALSHAASGSWREPCMRARPARSTRNMNCAPVRNMARNERDFSRDSKHKKSAPGCRGS